MAAGSSSAPLFGLGEEDHLQTHIKQHQPPPPPPSAITSSAAPPPAAPQKKRRNLPGNPNPDAEVIALSPKTLLATNRFICEVCNKGFQREQNLQLHRRGHNLPWKLRQKSTAEVRQRVYLCPEPTCVHHDPSRALGDLTGIKKHFCRKHGEKKWKCDKCSKRYAVQSDLKAHSKTCGTREYRCGCGTLFSRRDSFITHRAFCDALAQENSRLPAGLNTIGSQLFGGGGGSGGGGNMGLGLSQIHTQVPSVHGQNLQAGSGDLLRLGAAGGRAQFDHLIPPSSISSLLPPQASAAASGSFFLGGANQDFRESQPHHHSLLQSKSFHGLMQLPPEMQSNNIADSSPAVTAAATSVANLFNLGFFSSSSSTSNITSSNNMDGGSIQSPHLLVPDQFGSDNAAATEQAAAIFHRNLMSSHMACSGGHPSLYGTSVQSDAVLPQMSATALLQKASQMGAASSGGGGGGSFLFRGFEKAYPGSPSPANCGAGSFGNTSGRDSMRIQGRSETHLQDLMNSLADGNVGIDLVNPAEEASFRASCTGGGHEAAAAAFRGLYNMEEAHDLHQNLQMGSIAGSDRLTRDFLGVGSMMRSIGGATARREPPHHAVVDMAGSFDSEVKSASSRKPFVGGNLH